MADNEKRKAYTREWLREDRKKNPNKYRNMDLVKNFGVTLEEYNQYLETQNGVCAICGSSETVVDNRTKRPRSLAVDHCHTTKKVRGLLCMGCNQGLGNFRDNPDFLAKAISYLIKNGP